MNELIKAKYIIEVVRRVIGRDRSSRRGTRIGQHVSVLISYVRPITCALFAPAVQL